jgi:hypothetical protein
MQPSVVAAEVNFDNTPHTCESKFS